LPEDDAPKSAYEIILERLKKKDRDDGVEEHPLSGEQKDRIAGVRQVYEARLAEREILHQASRRKAQDLETLDKLEGYDQLPGEKGVKKALEGVPNQPIEGVIVWSEAKPASGAAPLTVSFSADQVPGAAGYEWSFGDGEAAKGTTASHTYTKPGVYKVALKVTGASGVLGEDELRVKVTK